MLSVSDEFRKAIAQNTKVLLKGRIDFPSGDKLELDPADFMGQGATFTHATSTSDSFDIGAVVSGTVDVTLRNDDGRLDEYDFSSATITLWVGKELSAGVEWLRKGKYWIDQPDSYGEVFGFTALDATSLLDVPYSEVATSYPATLREIVDDACSHCGVSVSSAAFPNGEYVVQARPDDEAITCRDVVSYAAQASGNYVRARQSDDAIEISWYDVAGAEDWLDGGYFDAFRPYLSGDSVDGGTFEDYSSGYSADGGTFTSPVLPMISAVATMTLCTDDVLVTGVRVSAFDGEWSEEGAVAETALFGKEGYVLDIASNPFVQKGEAAKVAAAVGARVVDMRFRPFECTALAAPYLEPGDAVLLVDRHQRFFPTYLTSTTYKTNGYESFACSAETPARRTAQRFGAETQAIVKNKNLIIRERDERKRAIAELERIVGEGGGLYTTVETGDDGSKVYFLHDKPTIGESKIIWRMGAEALAVSTDGGKSYTTGLTAEGDAILKRVYAIGIDADHITAGSIVSRNNRGEVTFSTNIATGETYIGGSSIFIGPKEQTVAKVRCDSPADQEMKMVGGTAFRWIDGVVVEVTFTHGNTCPEIGFGMPNMVYEVVGPSGALTPSQLAWSPGKTVHLRFRVKGQSAVWVLLDEGGTPLLDELDSKVGANNVRNAFANDPTQVTISAGRVTFNAGTFVVNSSHFKVTSSGVITATSGTIGGFTIDSSSIRNSGMRLSNQGVFVSYKGEEIGHIHSNAWADNDSVRGLTFDLENNGDYMAWGWKRNASDNLYTWRLIYCSRAMSSYGADTLNVCCPLHVWATPDFHNRIAKNFWFDPRTGGANGGITVNTSTFVLPKRMNSNGTVAEWTTGCYMQFKAGVLMKCALPQ